MTKLAHIAAIRTLIENNELPEAFITDINNALELYTGAKAADTIAQIVEIGDDTYAWCNKHERYEIASNFRDGPKGRTYQVLCIAAELELNQISAEIKTQNDLFKVAETMEEFQDIQEQKKTLDAKRKGTYDYDERVEVDAEKWADYERDADTYNVNLEQL